MHARVLHVTAAGAEGGAIQAVRPLEDVDRSLRNLGIALMLVSLGGIALAVWLGRMVARTALRPVAQLTEAAEHVARTRDLSRRMDTSGKRRAEPARRELQHHARGSRRSRRRRSASSSRTPRTSCARRSRACARTSRCWPTRTLLSPDGPRGGCCATSSRQLEELTALVTDLVDLARGVEPELDMEDVRLDSSSTEAVERARRHAPDKAFSRRARAVHGARRPGPARPRGRNLLDNAAKWSPPGGAIEVSAARRRAVGARPRAGYRRSGHPARLRPLLPRVRARGLPGSGLGLAIVRQVAELHGGSVSVETPRGGGARFRLRIPLTS